MSKIENKEDLNDAIIKHQAALSEYENELGKLKADPTHYMTPGAKKYFRRVAVAYVILAMAFTVGVYAMTDVLTDRLRGDINKYIVLSCKAGIPTLEKFNAKLDADIKIQEDAQAINIDQGEIQRARLNQEAIEAAEASKLHVPTEEECEVRGEF